MTLKTHARKGTQNFLKNEYFIIKAVEKPRAKTHKGKCGQILKTGRFQNGKNTLKLKHVIASKQHVLAILVESMILCIIKLIKKMAFIVQIL